MLEKTLMAAVLAAALAVTACTAKQPNTSKKAGTTQEMPQKDDRE